MRLVVLGGSASATPELADALGRWPRGTERRPPLEVVLHGRTPERLELVASEVRRRVSDVSGPPVSVRTEKDLAIALEGADVVLDAVRIGGLAARVFDESYPQRYACPGEETMGPGGLANALRTVPVVRSFWATVMEVAPDALHINLTNPSGIVVAALEREFGGRVFSVCDSPIVFCDSVAERLGQTAEEVRRRYQGMNHLGWWLPRGSAELETTIDLATGVVPDVVRALGAIPAPYVRYYLQPAPILEKQRAASETRAQQLQRLEGELLQGYAAGASDLPRRGAVWYETAVLPLVDAWFNGSDEVLILGLRNDGRLASLPDEVVTEGPVRIPRPGQLEFIETPPLPPLASSILAQHAAYEAMAVMATQPDATRIDRLRAMLANPMVSGYDMADALVRDVETGSPS
jgi:6-phospho-beta-glucosidase